MGLRDADQVKVSEATVKGESYLQSVKWGRPRLGIDPGSHVGLESLGYVPSIGKHSCL